MRRRLSRPARPGRSLRAARGVSLIELLVALVIVSLGLLTLVALQAASLRYTRVAERRAVASLVASDLMERIRANIATPSDLLKYQSITTFASQGDSPPTTVSPACDALASVCDVGQMAAADLDQWRLAARRLLPKGAVLSKFTENTQDPNQSWLDLWVAWRDPVMVQATGVDVRKSGECPAEFSLATPADDTVRCMTWRVRP